MTLGLKIAPLINLSIRALTLLGKFILLFYMAKFLSAEEVGVYGLFVVLVSYSLYAVGFDFYTFSTRELVLKDKKEWGSFLKSQSFLIIFAYIVILPIILFLASYSIPTKWLFFLGLLIVLEHLNQELMRLLIIDKKTVMANNLLFIRSGLWCYLIIGCMIFALVENQLDSILDAWIVSDLIALIVGWLALKKGLVFSKSQIIQIEWLKSGLKICIPLLISTLILRAITTVDRLWLEQLEGLKVIAAYSLFIGLTNAIISFLETGVFSFIYPKMIQEKSNSENFRILVKKMFFQSLGLALLISIVLVISFPYFLHWIGKDIYYTYKHIFYVVLFANLIYCVSMVPHYILYAKHRDKQIVLSHILGLAIFILSTLVLIFNKVQVAVAYGLCCAFLSILIAKV
ncbi:oligosaccharide translocase Wzx, partial [Acinetobacter baumannii]